MLTWIKKHPLSVFVTLMIAAVAGSLSGYLPVDRTVRWLIRPVGGVFVSAGRGVGDWFGEIGQVGSLNEANEELRQQNLELAQELSSLRQAEQENQQLKDQLKFQQTSGLEGIGANIINYQPDSVRKFIRIDVGRGQGVKSGQPVLAGGYLVGQISTVDGATSEVMLVSDGEFRVLAKTVGTLVPGLVKGRPPENLTMERIARNQAVKVGELVVTSGLDGQFPPGVLIGQIVDISASVEAIFQTAQLKPALDLAKLRSVTVLKY